LQFLIKKERKKNFNGNFSLIFCNQYPGSGLDPDMDPYPDPDSLEMLDADPDPQHWIRCPGRESLESYLMGLHTMLFLAGTCLCTVTALPIGADLDPSQYSH
jgi:hypothetical protein